MRLESQIEPSLAGLLAGEPRATEQFLVSWQSTICSWVRQMMRGQEQETHDVIQDALIEVVRSIKSFRGERSSLGAWLKTLTHHTVCRHYRREKSRKSWLQFTDPFELELSSGFFSEVERADVSPLLVYLGPMESRLLIMRHLEGHQVGEIAELLRLSRSSVKRHLQRGETRARRWFFAGAVPVTVARIRRPESSKNGLQTCAADASSLKCD